jgi:peptidoglycan hydrolase CwlO-like protein
MGKIMLGLMCLVALGFSAQEQEYAPRISFKDIVQSQVGVVKKVMDLNEKVDELQKALAKLQKEHEQTYAKISQLENELSSKKTTTKPQEGQVNVPSSYIDLIDQAKSWVK